MTYRQLKPRALIEPQESKLSDRPLAIIARQSTTAQVKEHEESLKLQVEDARQRFISQGWSEDIITIRIAGNGKKGVSGRLRIDQRAELQETMVDIENGVIRAIGAYSVSRLFRDRHGVQVSVFMETCAKHDVLVILPDKTYDFNNESDITMFTILARFAAVENEQRTKLMKDARHRKALRGEYDGRSLPVGFIVDRVKFLADGRPNPTYGKFIEYEPHSRVVKRLYARFRELDGQFNLLSAEVARMSVVFPDFEDWVPPLNKLRLKKVPGGYHISRVGLLHLLTAIEYAGFWKVDGQLLTDADGVPVINHDAIVPAADWQYAFSRLSFVTLDGLPNHERTHGSTWVPVSKQDSSGSLRGLLTSPLGLVNCSAGRYRVAEQRPGVAQRSNTLVVDVELVDALFQARLSERMYEIDQNKFFYAQLAKLKQQHAKALLTVDEQIARYKKEREGIQNYIKAVGATADVATLQQYNADLLELSAHITELESKKQSAVAEVSSIARIRERLSRMKALLGTDGPTELSKLFIRLACEAIILNKYSSHFITLTIHWAAPFSQTDICFLYRAAGVHQKWSTEDEVDLTRLYPEADRLELYQRFPTRTWQGIVQLAYHLGLTRHTSLNTSGITNPTLSLADWQVFQRYDWDIPTSDSAAYWIYDARNDILETYFRRS